ncbi:MAG: Stp1/IreP family PP2C-type Ser/Thr phosphatase [Coriobacteriia bacterium]|nr:Stp1/IreP family PP2C-type Ser/Thr phosphatase [Coriobacteriia bacterium]
MKAPVAKSLSVGSRTDIGCVRDHNEDSLLVKAPLYVIADGMGGHAAGEIASELAIKTLDEAQLTQLDPDTLRHAVTEANRRVIDGARRGLGRHGMGTTLTAALIEGNRLLLAQVGDSRAYLVHEGQLRQLTRDHSLVGELLSTGKITEEEARLHPNRSVITRALGSDASVQPDLYEIRLHEGDRLLLCSDGLNTMLDDTEIEELLQYYPDSQEAADALIVAANNAGGFDNTTVIVINVDQLGQQAAAKQKKRFKWGILSFVVVFVLLVGASMGGVYSYARNVAFLIDEEGYVAVYRGLPGDFMGVELKWLEHKTTIKVDSLNPTTVGELKSGIRLGSLDEAERIVTQYEEQQRKKR